MTLTSSSCQFVLEFVVIAPGTSAFSVVVRLQAPPIVDETNTQPTGTWRGKSTTVAASIGGLPLSLSVARTVALARSFPVYAEPKPPGQAALVTWQRTSVNAKVIERSPGFTMYLTELSDCGVKPFASPVPTVRTLEVCVGGEHEGEFSGIPCWRLADPDAHG